MSLIYTQLAQDNFNRANENPLDNGVWTTLFGLPLQIVSNAAESVDASNGGVSDYTGISWPNDQWAEITLSNLAANGQVTLFLRSDDSFSDFIELIMPGSGQTQVISFISGNPTVLDSFPAAIAGETYRLAILGSDWYLLKNGIQIGTGTGSLPTGGSVNLFITPAVVDSDTTADNFAGGSVTSGPPPSSAYSVPDCRVAPAGPNASRTVQGTKIYDVQTSSNSAIPPTDSRAAGAPVDSRVSPNIPQNSRTNPPFTGGNNGK